MQQNRENLMKILKFCIKYLLRQKLPSGPPTADTGHCRAQAQEITLAYQKINFGTLQRLSRLYIVVFNVPIACQFEREFFCQSRVMLQVFRPRTDWDTYFKKALFLDKKDILFLLTQIPIKKNYYKL